MAEVTTDRSSSKTALQPTAGAVTLMFHKQACKTEPENGLFSCVPLQPGLDETSVFETDTIPIPGLVKISRPRLLEKDFCKSEIEK